MQEIYVSLESPAIPAGAIQLFELRGSEAIGKFFDFEVRLVRTSQEELDEAALLSNPAALVFARSDQIERRIFGTIHSVRDALLSESDHLAYTLAFVPRAWPMMHHKRSEIFLDTAIPDIIKTKLQRAGLDLATDCSFRLTASYPTREFVMQYEETDLAFCSRLCEHLGISFFFEHDSGKDVIVFSDDNSGFRPIEGDTHVPFHRRGAALGVHQLEVVVTSLAARYTLKDYNYRTPTVSLVAQAAVDPAGKGEVIEYGAHFKTTDEGDAIAQIRAEELLATKRVLSGVSEVPRIAAGGRFTLDDHPKIVGELLVTEVRHEAKQPTALGGGGATQVYRSELRAIDAKTTYRPPRVTPKPRVHGAISGVIETAAGGQYAELDDQGRYHVRFMLDQGGAPKGSASSLLRMAQPHAGPGYGFHFPLRDGVEVMLTCIDGDPDRPIITGAVPNPTTPTTVSSGNATRNVIRTGGGTEINIDDTDASTRFKITVPYAGTTFALGAPSSPQGFTVGTAQQALVETGKSIELKAGTTVDIHANGGDLTADASASVSINAKGGTTYVDGKDAVKLNGHPLVRADAAEIVLVGTDEFRAKGGNVVNVTGDDSTVEGVNKLALKSDTLVTVGGATITISGQKVTIEGTTEMNVIGWGTTNVNGHGGIVNIQGGTVKLNCG